MGEEEIRGIPEREVPRRHLIVFERRLPDCSFEEILSQYPTLTSVAKSDEAKKRIIQQWRVDQFIRGHYESKPSTYGQSAPTYRKAIESLGGALDHPRILILGAETPGSVRQVVNFTKIYSPKEIILADKEKESLDLAKAYGESTTTVQVDFTISESSGHIPPFDIALGDRILDYVIKPNMSEERQNEVFGDFLSNISQKMSKEGGIVLTDYGVAVQPVKGFDGETVFIKTDVTGEMFSNISKVNGILVKKGLRIDSVTPIQQFKHLPHYNDLMERSYNPLSIKTQPQMRTIVIKKI